MIPFDGKWNRSYRLLNIRHQHGYAFMGGIRLRQDFGERNNPRLTGQKRIRLPLISVELPVQCAGKSPTTITYTSRLSAG